MISSPVGSSYFFLNDVWPLPLPPFFPVEMEALPATVQKVCDRPAKRPPVLIILTVPIREVRPVFFRQGLRKTPHLPLSGPWNFKRLAEPPGPPGRSEAKKPPSECDLSWE